MAADRKLWDAWHERHDYPAHVHLANFIAHAKAIDAVLQPEETKTKIPLVSGLRAILEATDIPQAAYDLGTTRLAVDKLVEWGHVNYKDGLYSLPKSRIR